MWREALLAQAVLAGRTAGYRRHPQLRRFIESPDPRGNIARYLAGVYAEGARRGYRFDERKIGPFAGGGRLPVTRGQMTYEWAHLRGKLRRRSPSWLQQLRGVKVPAAHPLFRVVRGGIAEWEVGARA